MDESDLLESVKQTLEDGGSVMFTTTGCHGCKQQQKVFERFGVADLCRTVNVEDRPDIPDALGVQVLRAPTTIWRPACWAPESPFWIESGPISLRSMRDMYELHMLPLLFMRNFED